MDYFLLISSIVAGAVCFFYFELHRPRPIKLLNAFTGAYLLCLTLLHLLPELYRGLGGSAGSDLHIGAYMLFGFFIQIALDVISMGVEHGHAHHVHGRMIYGVMVGLCLHAFLEALALGNRTSHYDPSSRQLLLYSIVLHNFPVSIALLGMLIHHGRGRGKALAALGVFALMGPLGMTVGGQSVLAAHSRELMAIVIGIFMHISTTILFESSEIHKFDTARLAAIAVGLLAGIASVLVH